MNAWLGAALFLFGIAASALYSGSETGLYRATRVKILLDGLAGNRLSRALVWLTNRPALFIATALAGNNLAHHLVSFAIIVILHAWAGPDHPVWDTLLPMLLTPVVFLGGDLVPKGLFYEAPNRLLRLVAPVLLFSSVLFLPVTGMLFLFNKLLEWLSGESPPQLRLALARQELEWVFREGHEVGLIHTAQRRLAQGLFAAADRPVSEFLLPLARAPRLRLDMTRDEALRAARRWRAGALLVEEAWGRRRIVGYVRAIDLLVAEGTGLPSVRPLVRLAADECYIAALGQLAAQEEPFAQVVGADGQTLGVVTIDRLYEPLLRPQK